MFLNLLAEQFVIVSQLSILPLLIKVSKVSLDILPVLPNGHLRQ